MATWAVGDIQGCYDPLRRLLDTLQFDPDKDTLWVAGDMVNRGPKSLQTLRFLQSLGNQCVAVMGNHDLHLLGVATGLRTLKKGDTIESILDAPDAEDLLKWVRHRPFLHHDDQRQITMVHAGIPPMWTLKKAIKRADKLTVALQSNDYEKVLKNLFKSDEPCPWSQDLGKKKKQRMTAAYFTRMRFCDQQGQLDLENKSAAPGEDFAPWFAFPKSPCYRETIIFGHWAALEGETGLDHIHAIDTGCVWRRYLTAINLDTFERTEAPHC